MLCDGTCDGLPTSHGEDDLILGEDGRTLCLSAWPGGPETPVCVSWALGHFVADVTRAANWAAEGQQLGPLDSIAPVVADGVMVIRREHRAIVEEGRKQ